MDILICSKLFFPENQIGAVRVTNFAKYLNELGHNVTVLTESPETIFLNDQFANSIKIINVRHSNSALKLIDKVAGIVNRRKGPEVPQDATENEKNNKKSPIFYYKLKESAFQLYHLFLEHDWYFQAKKIMKQTVNYNRKFDLLISSYSPLSSVLIARHLKKKGKGKYWIADLRDSMDKEQYSMLVNKIYNHFQKNMVEKADAITVVSKGQAQMLKRSVGEKLFNRKIIKTIYNGYEKAVDFEILRNSPSLENDDHNLKITYTGSLYQDRSDMSMLFEALRELIDEKEIDSNNINVHYAGHNSTEFAKQSTKYDLKKITIDHGFLSRADSIKLQLSSDILVALCWNTEKELGILSGKFFEYLQSFKPIIGIVSGNLPNSELSDLINELKVGIGCEYIRKSADLPMLKEYLLSLYQNKLEHSSIEFSPRLEKVKFFQYNHIVKQLEEICYSLIK